MKITILDLVPRFKNETIKDAIDRTTSLALYADEKGFDRFWLAEHHNSKAVVGGATDLIIQHILSKTERIRLGAGGVMLPNHTPFQVAERYGTLEALYPNRIDLGIGRAPGTDLETAKLIYRKIYMEDNFRESIEELLGYFDGNESEVSPFPGTGSEVPIYILGSSTTSAKVAADLGLAYAFAGHFSPNRVAEAFSIYEERFTPSKYLDKPYKMLALSTYLADSEEDAKELDDHGKQIFLQLSNRNREEFFELDPDFEKNLSSIEKFMIKSNRGLSITGNPEKAKSQWEEIKNQYEPDELIATTYIPDLDKLIKNYDILFDIILQLAFDYKLT